MNQALHFNPRAIVAALNRKRGLMVTLVIVALFGYTGLQISRISAIQPNAGYVATKQATTKIPTLHVSPTVIQRLNELQPAGITAIPLTTGKQDPFAFN